MIKALKMCSTLLLMATWAATQATYAQEKKQAATSKKSEVVYAEIEADVSTQAHTLDTQTGKIKYETTSGFLRLKNEKGEPSGHYFFIAYTSTQHPKKAQRPICFSYNGGPGSSSVYLHLGALGPKKVKLTPEGKALGPPYALIDNPHSWLYHTDLVFIDPIGTGFSRPNTAKDKKHYGYQQDVKSVSTFIHRYLTYYNRWQSPKFLAGESYGTTRSAGVARHLVEHHGIYLNGVMLVSSVLNFQTLRSTSGNTDPMPLFLPAYTATAWHHKQLPAALQALPLDTVVERARQFAASQYRYALFMGHALPQSQRQAVAAQLQQYTGLEASYWLQADLKVNPSVFRKKLLANQGLSVGRYDSRYTMPEPDPLQTYPTTDASSTPHVRGAFSEGINHYLRDQLGYKNDMEYRVFAPQVHPWQYQTNSFLDATPDLSKALTLCPQLQVHIFNGYYDLATPFFATEHTVNQMQITPEARQRIAMSYYKSGHMMYLPQTELEKFTKHAADFIISACPKGQ